MTKIHGVLGLVSAALVLACTSASHADPAAPAAQGGQGGGEFRYKKALADGAKVEVRNVNGPIVAEPAAGDTLEVVAVKTGRPEDVARVQITAREEGGAIVLCALWPGEDASACRAGSRGGSAHDIDATVELKLRVPAAVKSLSARTLNGRIAATGLHGEARLATLNGAVTVDAGGPIVATTLNGAVDAKTAGGSPVRLETTNGAITLALPASAGADVYAATTAGLITSDFGAVPPPSIPMMHSARFRVGAGGAAVTLRTTHGDVHVRRL